LQKKIFFVANFYVLGLFIPKKPKKNFGLSRGVAGVAVRALVEIRVDDISAVLRATDLRFRLPFVMGLFDAPHTQNFEILKFLEQTQESKNFKISFEIL
jgi:hypothetical protein